MPYSGFLPIVGAIGGFWWSWLNMRPHDPPLTRIVMGLAFAVCWGTIGFIAYMVVR
jgi:hypothetical protein